MEPMRCMISWDHLQEKEWDALFARLPRSTLLQDYDYARAVCPLYGQKARWGLITVDGQEAGLVQILEAGLLWNALHAVILDRGPLWLPGYGGAAHLKAFFTEFGRQFPARFGRKRRLIPEIEDGSAARAVLAGAGLTRLEGRPGYETLWLDLTKPQDRLHAGLHKKWRNALSKARRSGLEVEWDLQGRYFSWLMDRYTRDRALRAYAGPAPKTLQNIVTFSLPKGNIVIGRAMLDNNPVASILIICHGTAATYQVGWTSEKGRETAAHNLLLWEATGLLQKKGITAFDLGGCNAQSAKNVQKFKQAMGAAPVRLVGHYS